MSKNEKRSYGFQKKKKFYGEKKAPDKAQQRIGIYTQGRGNFGFVDVIEFGEKKGFYVHETKKADAFPGDEVYFYTKVYREKEEAVITGVKQRTQNLVIGKLQIQKSYGFVIPESQYLPADIFVPGKFLKGYKDGQRVGVQIINWKGKNPEGRILEVLPNKNQKGGRILGIALEGGARITFPTKVLEEADSYNSDDIHKEISHRKDMRSMLTFTIDGSDSKDLDDALSIEKQENGDVRLFVHIADVSHYVSEGSALDREARQRGTSIYMVNKVVPMLPEKLSNDLCSLHPGAPKLTLTCEILINSQGHTQSSKVYESVICSDYRLTYKEVQEVLNIHIGKGQGSIVSLRGGTEESSEPIGIDTQDIDSSPKGSEGRVGEQEGDIKQHNKKKYIKEGQKLHFGGVADSQLIGALQSLSELRNILSKYKHSKGVLHFDFPETKIEVDEHEKPIRFYEYERYDSHKIIEECMILANEAVAYQFQRYPFLYRVHEVPDEEDVEKFAALLKKFDVEVNIPDISSKSFQHILTAIEGNPKSGALQKMLLRTLMKARYSEKNFGHFGLASKFYSHFTSPIRRYPDLQIHRIIKETLQRGNVKTEKRLKSSLTAVKGRGNLSAERISHYQEILPKVALKSSEREVLSEKIEYRVRDYMAVQYMKDQIGQTFEAKVSGMIDKGFFIELPNTIEGFVEFGLSNLSYDAENFSIFSPTTGKELTFGDSVQVALIRADEETLRLDFELVE